MILPDASATFFAVSTELATVIGILSPPATFTMIVPVAEAAVDTAVSPSHDTAAAPTTTIVPAAKPSHAASAIVS